MKKSVTAIFDIGKTNKKFFLFDDTLQKISEEYCTVQEIKDDDGFPCDDLDVLVNWIKQTTLGILNSSSYRLSGLNFSTYGATLVHLDSSGKPVTPLYNYLKPYPPKILNEFFRNYPEEANNLETASPNLGMLNSALQLYWLKKCKPEIFKKIRHTLHFPQYLSYLFTGKMVSEPTSIGCHTKLWDFTKNSYHSWIEQEALTQLLREIVSTTTSYHVNIDGHEVKIGVGIHDSSAALTTYLFRTTEPFALISTGTWSITLNPFTAQNLTTRELERDCLLYMTTEGKPVKASRLFLGRELDFQTNRLSEIFHKDVTYYKQVKIDSDFITQSLMGVIKNSFHPSCIENPLLISDIFTENDWHPEKLSTYEEAYHYLIWGLVQLQVASVHLAIGTTRIKKIFIDGGFTSNELFIQLLRHSLPAYTIEISDKPLGSAYGAALVLRNFK